MGIGSSEVEETAATTAVAPAAPAASEAPAASAVSTADVTALQTRIATLEGQVKNLQDRMGGAEHGLKRLLPYG